jgi:hypothetical protein
MMGWDEAYATWHAIQVGKTRQEDYLKSTVFQQDCLQREVQAQAIRTLAQSLWLRFVNGASPLFVNISQTATNTLRGLLPLLNSPRNALGVLRDRVMQPIIDITDKLATILGDAKKLLDDILHHNVEVLKSLIAKLQWEERMAQVQSLMKRVLGQFSARKVFSGLVERVRSLFGRLMGFFDQSKEEEDLQG